MIMRIQELRQKRDMTQLQLAVAMGTVQSCVSDWERETVLPRTRQLSQLAKVLGVTIGDLFEPEEDGTADSGNDPY